MKKKTVLVLNRIALIMNDDMVQKFGELANENRERASDLNIIMLSKMQQAVNLALANENPEACCRADIAWTECGLISTSGFFVIATTADDEVTNHFEDHDYLNHLRSIERIALESGFKLQVEPIRALSPFDKTEIPASMK
ncbi:hypothetical protein HOT49_gp318 [Erwinia phage vB_EamM_Alexandra]|uniref:Uncharacterized protein n=1 Tax=Erwinia phage vB_EamM_Alexandra TaxID=2201424 RepID=A0A2Z4QF18_9CAUD|nr:hypothetical protein HOT49_gp318 [Erwinia phage vB_EamM_Alexandra]AWY08573.1 hypothetical protein Alexandra_322 [Erwinia phage vB_EamM_Alexandra]